MAPTTTTTTTSAGKVTVSSAVASQSSSSPAYRIALSYPVVHGLTTAASRAVNGALLAAVDHAETSFTSQVPLSAPGPGIPYSGLKASFATVRAGGGIVSFELYITQWDAGAAHPVTAVQTFNFNTATGHEYSLRELFNPGSSYLDALSSISRSMLAAQLGQGGSPSVIDQGTAPAPANFSAWALGDASLHVVFSDYQVASYAQGIQEVKIPYSRLAGLLAKAAPVH